MDYEVQFSLAGLNLMLHMPHQIIMNESFQPFVTESIDKTDIHIRIYEEDRMDFPRTVPVCTKIPFCVYEDDKGYYRVFHDHKENDTPYAAGRILSDTEEEIHYLIKCRMFFSESHNTFSHIALEDLLLRRNAVILHASYIDTMFGGILFSGPSGQGTDSSENGDSSGSDYSSDSYDSGYDSGSYDNSDSYDEYGNYIGDGGDYSEEY